MIASAGASRNSVGCACGSISSAPPSKRMNIGSLAGSVTPATLTAPVPSVSSAAALRSTASRALASAVAGEEALSSTTSLSCFLPLLELHAAVGVDLVDGELRAALDRATRSTARWTPAR